LEDNIARKKALKAYDLIKLKSPSTLLPRVTYKKLKDGYAEFERLRPLVKPQAVTQYDSLPLQHFKDDFERGTLDDVLSVLIEPHNGGWRWDVVLSFSAFGSPEGHPCPTREEAERMVLDMLGMLGSKMGPAPGYTPVADTGCLPIVFDHPNGRRAQYKAPNLNTEDTRELWSNCVRNFPTLSPDELIAAAACQALTGNDEDIRKIVLTLLANLKWTHVTNEIIDQYCAAEGVDLHEVKRKIDEMQKLVNAGIDVAAEAEAVKKDGIDITYRSLGLRADHGSVERAKQKAAAMSPLERETEREKLIELLDGIQDKVNDGEALKDMGVLFHAMCDLHALDAMNLN
jgi:hypothetical protein